MVILRPTRKLQKSLPPAGNGDAVSETALGDWYVNRLVVDRRPLLLLVSSRSLLPILIPAREVRSLPKRLADLVGARLNRMEIADHLIARETQAMSPVLVRKTSDRSVLGILVDFAKSIPYYLEVGIWDENALPLVEDLLAKTPCYAGRRFEEVVFPDRKTSELLAERWHAG